MRHFPVFLDLTNQRVVVSGAGEVALAKLRLILKTAADVWVFGPAPHQGVVTLADNGRVRLVARHILPRDADGARLVYGANDDARLDARAAFIGRKAGALVNVVDDLDGSDFITPAIVDRAPVTVAIGTEGAAPVLARQIKAKVEEMLPPALGALARVGQGFRSAAEVLPMGRARRAFWSAFYFGRGAEAFARDGVQGAEAILGDLLDQHLLGGEGAGRVDLVGAGSGDPELLTLKARKALHEADVVLHDNLVAPEILELARREAVLVETGKRGFGAIWAQEDINGLMVEHALAGHHVVRLKSGDPAVYGRRDAEMEALDAAGVEWSIVPGVTMASWAATAVSLPQRGRHSALRLVTGHDVRGFAAQDWTASAQDGSVAENYLEKKAEQA